MFCTASLAGAAPFVDGWLFSEWGLHPLTWLASASLGLLVVALGVARLGALRDEDNTWRFSLAAQRLMSGVSSLVERFVSWWSLDLTRKMLVVLGLVTGLSVLALSACSAAVVVLDVVWLAHRAELVGAQEGARLDGMLVWAQGLVLSCLVLSVVGRAWLRRSLRGGAPALPGHSDVLPPVLDCNDVPAMRALAGRTSDPAVRDLLGALVEWKPRHHERERGYQDSLLRHLKGRLPELEPDDEHPLPSPTGKRSLRADLTVGPVLIEMKRSLSTSTVQRAIGQMGMYLDAWKSGPLLLLVCDTDPALAHGWLRQEVEHLRARGPVSLVLARGGR